MFFAVSINFFLYIKWLADDTYTNLTDVCGVIDTSSPMSHYVEIPSGSQSDDGRPILISRSRSIRGPVVSKVDKEWTNRYHVLWCRRTRPDTLKVHISGPCTLSSNNTLVEIRATQDQSSSIRQFTSVPYCLSLRNRQSKYPIHWPCFQLLARAITKHDDVTSLDTERLFDAFSYDSRLGLADCTIPEEISGRVALYGREEALHPSMHSEDRGSSPHYDSHIPLTIASQLNRHNPGMLQNLDSLDLELQSRSYEALTSPLQQLNLECRVKHDPFEIMPVEIIHHILQYLDWPEIHSSILASYHIHQRTLQNNFWLRQIKLDLPWFWELQDLARAKSLGIDLKVAYLWARNLRPQQKGMTSLQMHLANRKRIWAGCERLAAVYNLMQECADTFQARFNMWRPDSIVLHSRGSIIEIS